MMRNLLLVKIILYNCRCEKFVFNKVFYVRGKGVFLNEKELDVKKRTSEMLENIAFTLMDKDEDSFRY